MQRAMLRLLLLAFSLLLSTTYASTTVACPPGMQCTPITTVTDKLADDVATLKRDNEVLKQRLDDLNSHEANQIGMLSNQSSLLGSLIAAVSLLITLLTVGVGLFVHKRTEALANKFEQDSKNLIEKAERELEEIKETKREAKEEIRELTKQITSEYARSEASRKAIEVMAESLENAIKPQFDVIERQSQAYPSQITSEADQKIADIYATLRQKPAIQMTAMDYYVQSVAAFTRQDSVAALQAIENGLSDQLASTRDDILTAKLLYGKALCQSSGDAQIEMYKALVDRFENNQELAIQEQVAKAMLNLGVTYGRTKQIDNEIKTYQKLIKRHENDSDPKLKELVACAIYNLGHLYSPDNKAIRFFQQIIDRYGKDQGIAIRRVVALAMDALGTTYNQKNKYSEAIDTWEKVIRNSHEYNHPLLHEPIAMATYHLGVAYAQNNQTDRAINYFQQTISDFENTPNPEVKKLLAKARNSLGYLLLMQIKTKQKEEREKLLAEARSYFTKALIDSDEADKSLILGNLGYANFLQGQKVQAETYTRKCLELGGEAAYQTQLKDALEYQDTQYEAMLHQVWEQVASMPS